MSVRDSLKVVVIGVLGHATVQERPGQVIHSILLVLNGLCHNLRIKMVMQEVIQMRLQRWKAEFEKNVEKESNQVSERNSPQQAEVHTRTS